MADIQYNRNIRNLIIGFGNLFKDLRLIRYNPDLSEQERFVVPITYAPKEQYVMRLTEDPDLDKKVQLTLPRMSYEMTGFTYDSSRKLNSNLKNFAQTPSGLVSQYNPVPYNFDFNLYLYVRNIEDGHQLLELILPYFNPDYTIKINMIPEMGIVKEVPIILNSTSQDINYEGNRDSEPRMVIYTLNFTVKGNIYGKSSNIGVIKTSITNIYNKITDGDVVRFTIDPTTGVGDYKIGEAVFQGFSYATSNAKAVVVDWSNNILSLSQLDGNFVSNLPIQGFNTGTQYKFTSYNVSPKLYSNITVTPNPANANATDPWTANTIITEQP